MIAKLVNKWMFVTVAMTLLVFALLQTPVNTAIVYADSGGPPKCSECK